MAEELVSVGQFQFQPEAEAARMCLEAEDIPTFLADAETVNMDWLLGNAIGYIKLQVPVSRAAEAREVLERARAEQERRAAEPRPGAEAAMCLSCGAAMASDQSRCSACGWTYTGDEEADVPVTEEVAVITEDAAPGPIVSERLRSLRRPVFILLLWPVVLGLAILLLALCGFFE